ncbi:GINS complex, PSF2 component [Tilletiaria anomala UBC 951]|uniref:DNA replication complex GINS protein PSF2 n=1 Tax=Tilletiaria anomala (strain ATCC 24038 / CBS 436.72 / UBC 951) TaxID=1037660 RepID=A0A066VM12_TILAU|nr:GINS complex, PSF2 component [Tilletiaria anomala UBC 951]KDN39630.1 GINS complex, PSF2 component [Tilletiaria anomala UBC 951]
MAAIVRRGLLPTEIEYLAAESTEIDIVPSLSLDRVRLLGGIYGPFRPPATCKVPLWLAINLRSKKKCKIVPPEWMSVGDLREAYDQEVRAAPFAKLPQDYAIIAKVLLETASSDIPDSDQIRGLLKDLREARQAKVISGLSAINSAHLEMTNVTSLEICELRAFFTTAFNHLKAIESNAAATNDAEETNNTAENDLSGLDGGHALTFDDTTMG